MTRECQCSASEACVHTFEFDGRHYAFNGNSMMLAEVSAEGRSELEGAGPSQRSDADDDIGQKAEPGAQRAAESLRGQLHGVGFFRPRADATRVRELDDARIDETLAAVPRPTLVQLSIAGVCNMRCSYCYANYGAFAGKPGVPFMPVETVRQSTRLLAGASSEAVRVGLLGGEPLLHPRIGQVLDAIQEEAAAIKKRVVMQVDTNGTVVSEEILKGLAAHDVGVSVSWDGPDWVQDAQRPLVRNGASFDMVRRNVHRLIDRLGLERIGISVTCSPSSVNAIIEFWSHLRRVFGPLRIKVSPAWVPPGHQCAWTPEATNAWAQVSRELARLEAGSTLAGGVPSDAIERHAVGGRKIRLSVCAFATTQLAVGVDGVVYPCIALVGRPEFAMGSVAQGELSRSARVADTIAISSVVRKAQCQSCWAKYLCAGGCPVVALSTGGDASRCTDAVCDMLRKNAETDLIGFVLLRARSPLESTRMTAC